VEIVGLGVRSACLIALEVSPCHERNGSGGHDQRMILRGNMVEWRKMGLQTAGRVEESGTWGTDAGGQARWYYSDGGFFGRKQTRRSVGLYDSAWTAMVQLCGLERCV